MRIRLRLVHSLLFHLSLWPLAVVYLQFRQPEAGSLRAAVASEKLDLEGVGYEADPWEALRRLGADLSEAVGSPRLLQRRRGDHDVGGSPSCLCVGLRGGPREEEEEGGGCVEGLDRDAHPCSPTRPASGGWRRRAEAPSGGLRFFLDLRSSDVREYESGLWIDGDSAAVALEYSLFDAGSQAVACVRAGLERGPGGTWRYSGGVRVFGLSAAPACGEDEGLLPGLRPEVLRRRQGREDWLLALPLLLCFLSHSVLFLFESDWRRLFGGFSVYGIFDPEAWWPRGAVLLNASVLAVYVSLAVHFFAARGAMGRAPCIARGHEDDFLALDRLLRPVSRFRSLLVCLGLLMAAKFCVFFFGHVRRKMLVQLATYLVFLTIAMAAFSIVLYHHFGSAVDAYSSPWKAFFAVFLAFLGEISMHEMTSHSPILGTLIFLFTFFIFAVVMMFFIVEVISADIEEP